MSDNPAVLMGAYLGLVRAMACKIHRKLPRHVDLDDLIGYGCIGLAEAARAYQSSRNVKFSTFAHLRIRGAILDGLEKMSWFRRDKFLNGEYERELAGAYEDRTHINATEATDEAPPVEELLAQQELHQRLRQLINALPSPAAELLKATYFEGSSLTEAAERLGHTKSWASRLHAQVVSQLALTLRTESLM